MNRTIESTVDVIDHEGVSAFTAHRQHLQTLKITVATLAIVVLALSLGIVFAISRPAQVAIIRVDAVRGAELVRPANAALDLREADVRSFLWHWCIFRYRIVRSTAKEDFHQSYYFLSPAMIAQYKPRDTQKVAAILAGTEPEQTVDVRSIAMPPLKTISSGARKLRQGRAEIHLVTRENLDVNEDQDQTKRVWRVDIEYLVDPIEAAKKAKEEPLYQIKNPLGITITGYYETRLPDMEKTSQ